MQSSDFRSIVDPIGAGMPRHAHGGAHHKAQHPSHTVERSTVILIPLPDQMHRQMLGALARHFLATKQRRDAILRALMARGTA